jgi:Xaa-Pro aminopeptidase
MAVDASETSVSRTAGVARDVTQKIVREKTAQAVEILEEKGLDLWITFVRETSQVSDPMLDLLVGFDLTWISALMIHRSGKRVAVVGRYDVDNMERLGAYDEVIGYDQAFQPDLVRVVKDFNPRSIAVNFSEHDPAADGLTYGLYRLLSRALAPTLYGSRLISAEAVVAALRGRKTPTELDLIRAAVRRTQEGIATLTETLHPGITDETIADFLHRFLDEHDYGPAWERDYCPVVTVGPESSFGHGMTSGLQAERGNLIHIDFGISRAGFVSDLQRVWYLPAEKGETALPEDVSRAWTAVTDALEAGRSLLKPGVPGWEVDAVARETLVGAGYPEYMHAFGHQIGRSAHDGATILGPKWERYGTSVDGLVEPGNVFAIELGVAVEGRGYVSREENVVVTERGAEYLSQPQEEVWVLD